MPRAALRNDPLGASITLVATTTVFGFVGHWLDGKLDTLPLFLIIGILLGLAGGFLHLLLVVAPDLVPFVKRPGVEQSAQDDPPSDSSSSS